LIPGWQIHVGFRGGLIGEASRISMKARTAADVLARTASAVAARSSSSRQLARNNSTDHLERGQADSKSVSAASQSCLN
jgi:hypothetical protein